MITELSLKSLFIASVSESEKIISHDYESTTPPYFAHPDGFAC
jgi:hypothetical protein